MVEILLDIFKYTIAGLGIVWAAFYLAKPYLDRAESIQLLEFKKSINAQTLPLRLQAYERIVLFIERINPANIILRLNSPGLSAAEMHALIVNEVRNEYQHNITQQIYVSTRAWGVVKQLKNDTLSVTNNAIKALPEDATALDLGKAILAQLSRVDINPYDASAELIRADLEDLF
jgi:hypothetical protein